MNAANKAHATRKALNRIRDFYGDLTADEVRMIRQGRPSVDIADATGDSVSSVAAVRANWTRGTYDWAFVA